LAREQLTDIPTIYIDTENRAGINSKTTYTPGTVTVVSADEQECCTEVSMNIRGRGNSTWGMAKKPFRMKLDKKAQFMNLPAKAKNWVMLANYADKTLMRNAIAFEISSFIGLEYTPSVKFVDVVLNDEYIGNYMITDQTEVNPGRVPVEEQEPTDTTEPAITGGYLLEVDGFADGEPVWFQTEKEVKVTIKYPKDDEINQQQRDYITAFVCEFERRLFADDFDNPETGYASMVNWESLVNWYIACELTGNSDSFWSTYLYKKRDDARLHFGPLWDYDIAFNNDNRLGNAVRKLMREHAHNPRTWIARIWKDAAFRLAVAQRWKQLIDEGIEQHLLDTVDAYAALIDGSQKLNFEKWTVLSDRVYLETALFDTYQGGVDYLKDYITGRVSFLSDSFAEGDPSSWGGDIDTCSSYLIRHYSGCYLGETDNTCRLAAKDDAAEVQFAQIPGDSEWYSIALPSGLYLGSNDRWDIKLFDEPSDKYAHFKIEKASEPGYLLIRNEGNRCLGTDINEPGGGIYTDKSGSDLRHLWKLEKQEPESSVTAITTAARLTFDGSAIYAPADCRITVCDIAGHTVACGTETVSTAGLPAGVYIAVAYTADGTALRMKFHSR
ncbi:MAG: CotH kinase family protein, partial [Muribaculaceae bacterium]|nr:CotH kinase family protein [Muribaculaceae bacterium]